MTRRARVNRLTSSLMLVMLAGLMVMPGCRKALLSPNDDRTQFDRYDRVRNQWVPQYIEDEYGRRTPNLRGRLGPR